MTLSVPDKTKVNAKRYWRMHVSSTVWFHFPAQHWSYAHGKVRWRPNCHQV